ncbi:hypothetical protein [Botrimarina mediterranea]|uniref:hypothetical protein n=1 Tax=Botrimarina mediterranea TaxID=2528022 RepID=UPI0011879858|nr:hypothetical protein K2D_12120 [Planctomycetes bacterium K2D]
MHCRLSAAVLAVVGCLGTSGCSVWSYAWRVNVSERKLFCLEEDNEVSLATYRTWADQAWAEAGACCPEDCLAADYAWGFREGFAEYVYAGGNGEPPAMPPRPYWQADLRSREGAAAASSWFAGYRHGARVARDGGYRAATTLKLSGSLRDCDACGCQDNELCGVQATEPADESGPVLDAPSVIPPPAEIVIPFERPDASGPADGDDDDEFLLPSLDSGVAKPAPLPTGRLEPPAMNAADQGRVRTALFHIVR